MIQASQLRRLATSLALIGLLGCRPSTSTRPGPSPADAGDDADATSERETDPGRAADEAKPEDTPDADGSPPGWASLGPASGCELACAEVYACVLVAGERGEAEAAAIELGCLDACVSASARPSNSLFGCALPPDHTPGACAAFSTCARDAWPRIDDAPASSTADPIVFQGRGCERACRALAWCGGVDQSAEDVEAISLCRELCIQALGPELEREAGECTELQACEAIEQCITALPGA